MIEVAIAAGFSRIPVYEQGIDDIVGIVYTKDLMRAEREGTGDEPVRDARAATRTSCPRPSGWPSCMPRDAGGEVPHGDRRRRVRRHRRPRHARGPHRGAGGRDRRRVRRRGAAGRAAARRRRARQRPHADRRAQRAARRRPARGRLGHRRRPRLNLLGHVPDRGRDASRSTATGSGREGAGPAHRPGAHQPRSPTPPTPRRRSEVGLRHPRRPAQRRQVDAAQPHPRHQGVDRLRQAADHAHAGPRRAQPARRAGRVRRHARHPQARARCSASGSTTPPTSAVGDVDVVVPACSTPPRRSARATSSSPSRVPPVDASCVVNKIDVASPRRRCSRS